MNPDDIDEVALNVLLAEGVDVPTALEASRRSTGDEGPAIGPGCIVAVLFCVVILLALRLLT